MNKEALLRRQAELQSQMLQLQELVLALMVRVNTLEARARQEGQSDG